MIEKATEEYRRRQNPLSAFVEDCAELSPQAWASTASLYRAYDIWREQNGEENLSARAFANHLQALGLKPKRKTEARGWAGIRLKSRYDA